MRHRISGKKLGRDHNQRQALLRSLVRAMFVHGHLTTTHAKAKFVNSLIEKLCTLSKQDDLTASRGFFRYFQDRHLSLTIVKALRQSFAAQSSNFTKLTKIFRRLGDQAVVVRLSFTQPYKLQLPVKDKDQKNQDQKVTKVTKKKETK